MKKRILAVLIAVLSVSLIGCGEQDVIRADNPTTVPTQNVSQESSEQLSVPEPTLTEDPQKTLEKYNSLLDEGSKYNDWSAAVEIKKMHDAGEISEEQLSALVFASEFREIRNLTDEQWAQTIEQVNNIADILNGKRKDVDEAGMDEFYENLCMAAQQDRVYINALGTQEQKDRVSEGIIYINHWLRESAEQGFDVVKQYFFSDELTPAEVILLSCHMYYATSENENRTDFLDSQGIKDYTDEALTELLSENIAGK